MQEVDLVDDEQPNQRGEGHVPCGLPGHHVPFLRRGDYHLSAGDLRLGHLHVAGQFAHSDAERLQSSAEVFRHFSGERLHGSHVDYLH